MHRVRIVFGLAFIVFLLAVFFCPVYSQLPAQSVTRDIIGEMQSNRVVISCEEGAGQGVVYHNDAQGAWVLTAKHVIEDSKGCKAMFRDGKSYDVTVQWESKKSDLAILQTNAEWPTQVKIVPVIYDSKIYAFGEVHESPYVVDHVVKNFFWDFNDDLYEGTVLATFPEKMIGEQHDVLNRLYSRPGSSGGGAFNSNGDLEGLVTRYSPYSNTSVMVDVYSTLKDEGIKQ